MMPIRIGPEGLLGKPGDYPWAKPYAEDMGKAMFNFAYPVTHPVEMFGGIGGLAAGGLSKAGIWDDPEAEELLSGAGDYLSQYSPENIGTTLRERPFSSAVDILPLAAGAYGVGRVGSRLGRQASIGGELAPDRIRAYHGSPYDFDKFDASKLGTGEGRGFWPQPESVMQGGAGFHMAEVPKVAERYRDVLTREQIADGFLPKGTKGKVYEVGIPKQGMLDLNKPISDLPADLRELAIKRGFTDADEAKAFVRKLQFELGDVAATRKLQRHGIKGTIHNDPLQHAEKYKGKNYSVFDPADIEILRKYGLIGAVGAGAYALPDDSRAAPLAFPRRR